MKINDCLMYFDEDMMLDVRLNTLDKYVSHFIIWYYDKKDYR